MIISFGDAATADPYHGRNTSRIRRFPQTITKVALRKLDMLNWCLVLNRSMFRLISIKQV